MFKANSNPTGPRTKEASVGNRRFRLYAPSDPTKKQTVPHTLHETFFPAHPTPPHPTTKKQALHGADALSFDVVPQHDGRPAGMMAPGPTINLRGHRSRLKEGPLDPRNKPRPISSSDFPTLPQSLPQRKAYVVIEGNTATLRDHRSHLQVPRTHQQEKQL